MPPHRLPDPHDNQLEPPPPGLHYLPHGGQHRSRVALRTALLLRRNQGEPLFARLKGRGIGNRGMNVPRWVSTDDEMKWLCYGTCLAFTLQRLAHLTGEYDRAHAEAQQRDLLTPCQPSATPPPAADPSAQAA